MPLEESLSEKIKEVIERINNRYEHIGRKTGAPFLAVIYPPEEEVVFIRELITHLDAYSETFDYKYIDVLEVTMNVVNEIGCEEILDTFVDPMPGSNPETELGRLWINAIAKAIEEALEAITNRKKVIVLMRLAALYPATSPQMLMHELWDKRKSSLDVPILILVPGRRADPRTAGSKAYEFLCRGKELMYRGDII